MTPAATAGQSAVSPCNTTEATGRSFRDPCVRYSGVDALSTAVALPPEPLEPVELRGVLTKDLALHLRRQGRHLLGHRFERLWVEARRVREVRLEQDAVGSHRVDEGRQVVLLEPERGVEVPLEVFRG